MSEKPKYYDEFVGLWDKSNDEVSENKYIEQSLVLGEYAKLNSQFIAVYHAKKQKIIYLSDNYLEIMGYTCTQEDYMKWSSLYWMRDLPIEQSWFFLKMSLFFRNTVQGLIKNHTNKKTLHWYIHNFKLKTNAPEKKHLSVLGQGLEFGKNGDLLILMTIIKEVSPLIKNKDIWWADFRVNNKEVFHYHCDQNKFLSGSIISEREKEILALIETGIDTNAIAETLNISTHTVDNHRKNMIDRTGAKDISSLIQIAKDGKII